MTREEAIRILERRSTIPDEEASWLDIMQAIDMAIEAMKGQRPHGEWIKDNMNFGFCDVRCSFCNSEYLDIDHVEKWNFCPCCGARMSKEGETK